MFLLMAFPQINELWCTSTRRFWTGPTSILMSQRGCLHNLCRTPLSKNQLQYPSLNSNHKSIARKMCVILLGRKQKWAYPTKFDFCQSVNGKNETEDTCMVSNFRFAVPSQRSKWPVWANKAFCADLGIVWIKICSFRMNTFFHESLTEMFPLID